MGEQIKNESSVFDSRLVAVFKVGDLVSWRKLNAPKEYGYIIKIYNQKLADDREFLFAKVRKPDGTMEPFMLSNIKKES